MTPRLSARIAFGIVLLGALNTASAQTYPECKVEFNFSIIIPQGTAKVRFSYRIPVAAPIPGNRWSPDGTEERYTFLSDQSFDYNETAGGLTLGNASGSIHLNPYHYPCNYFRFTGCSHPADVIPGTSNEGSNDVDVSSITTAGDVSSTGTFTQSLGTLMTHRIGPDGSSADFVGCSPRVEPYLLLTALAPPALNDLQVSVQNITLNATPEVKRLTDPLTGNIPLGARFTVSLQRIGPPIAPITANYGLGTATLLNAQTDPSLYPAAVLLEFNTATSEQTKTFQAVHLGTQNVVITPDDGSATQTITVKVAKPATLGTTHQTVTVGSDSFDLDAKIVEWADRRGIPPQTVKGIIDKETLPPFNPNTWRYEPLVWDHDNFAPRSEGNDERTNDLYQFYRMEYDNDHLRGSLLVNSEDVHPRHKFFSAANRRIDDADTMVTADTIYQENDFWQNWLANLSAGPLKQRIINDSSTVLNWTAQTTLAASYGLMQIGFDESFNFGGYAGIGGRRRPFYLFDMPANVSAGAGSIPVGSGEFVAKFRFANSVTPTPVFATPADFETALQRGLSAYNGTRRRGRITAYGRDAATRGAVTNEATRFVLARFRTLCSPHACRADKC